MGIVNYYDMKVVMDLLQNAAIKDMIKTGGCEITEDKELIYKTYDLQVRGNVEGIIIKNFINDVLGVYNINQDIIYDEFLDVRFFLQRIKGEGTDLPSVIQPTDIRSFDLNRSYLNYLKNQSRECFLEGQNDFDAEYSTVSDELQAQYFLTRFHNDPKEDQVCVFCFRLAAFILPCISDVAADELAEDQMATNISTGEKFRIDSIHFNSDILYNLEELDNLIYDHYFEIDGRCLEE